MPTNTLQDWFTTPLGHYLLEKEQAYLDDVTPRHLRLPRAAARPRRSSTCCARAASRTACTSIPAAIPDSTRRATSCRSRRSRSTSSCFRTCSSSPAQPARDPARGRSRDDARGAPRHRGLQSVEPLGIAQRASGFSRDEARGTARFVSLLRVKDWLALLGFDVSAGRLVGYAPPVRQTRRCDAASASWSPRAIAGGPWAARCTCCRPSSACAACGSSRPRGRSARTRARSAWRSRPSAKARRGRRHSQGRQVN